MHPLVRDLYKRAIAVGKDYPHPRGLDYVREQWKKALRDPKNNIFIVENSISCASNTGTNVADEVQRLQEKEMRKAVGKGRYAIREMIGVIQLKKYRTMRRRYNGGTLDVDGESARIMNACNEMNEPRDKK